jgi:RHH-type proline utilization regulon transcriptional repressor/proline dehydrogenase/delta 1-pyrroline-5-carboxylate dehydrogenase
VLCIAATAPGLVAQAAAALAAGNTLVVPASVAAGELVAALGAEHCATIAAASPAAMLAAADPAAVLVDADANAGAAIEWRRVAAARDGAAVPVLTPDAAGRYDPTRLVQERVVTTNTAAAGGNAALLSLSEDASAS